MDNLLRQDFLNRTVGTLENLIRDLDGERGETFSENFRREAFRALHTIKGTAQTLGFSASGKLAHELENLLAAADNQTSNQSGDDCKILLAEGLSNLKKSFEKKEFEISAAFLERVGARLLLENAEKSAADTSQIPDEIFSQLTNVEKGALLAALQKKKDVFCLQVNFNLQNFADEFVAFRETLCEKCEIVATLPAATNAPAAIAFRVLLATTEDIKETLVKNSAETIFHFAPRLLSNDAQSVFARLASDGESLAQRLGKQVKLEISASDAEVSPQVLGVIFDALAQLVRNAVDHAIERDGTIKINLRAAEDGFRLTCADDGRGIDLEKLRAKAVEKNLISGDASLTEDETANLIFAPELSTADSVSEISGGGGVLPAAKTAIEKIGGAIAVKSERAKGTTFNIFLPRA